MRKRLILPYFGKLNSYFSLWLESCRHNADIDWLVITDNQITDAIPPNVTVINKTFEELRNDFQKKFSIRLCLQKPYKLCDFKPFYGYLFSEHLIGYDFWGYCDCDLIFGNIRKFLPDSLFEQYDKLLRTGHLSFIRNIPAINENFKRYDAYKTTLTSPAIYALDESVEGYRLGFAGELQASGYRFYQNDLLTADIDFRKFPFHVVTAPEQPCIFSCENGALFRIDHNQKILQKTEMMYLHLQKRSMGVEICSDSARYLVYPNKFTPYDEDLLRDNLFWQTIFAEQKGYFSKRTECIRSLKRDILRFLYEPDKMRSLKYRLKRK